jgi:hypothetical protein
MENWAFVQNLISHFKAIPPILISNLQINVASRPTIFKQVHIIPKFKLNPIYQIHNFKRANISTIHLNYQPIKFHKNFTNFETSSNTIVNHLQTRAFTFNLSIKYIQAKNYHNSTILTHIETIQPRSTSHLKNTRNISC